MSKKKTDKQMLHLSCFLCSTQGLAQLMRRVYQTNKPTVKAVHPLIDDLEFWSKHCIDILPRLTAKEVKSVEVKIKAMFAAGIDEECKSFQSYLSAHMREAELYSEDITLALALPFKRMEEALLKLSGYFTSRSERTEFYDRGLEIAAIMRNTKLGAVA